MALLAVVHAGSSPLARGLRRRRRLRVPQRWIIPARAGFTTQTISDLKAHKDHPRSRGVYLNIRNTIVRLSGSSPLARGLLNGITDKYLLTRIIPARAGFTTIGID